MLHEYGNMTEGKMLHLILNLWVKKCPPGRDEGVPEDTLLFGHSAAVHKSAKDAL